MTVYNVTYDCINSSHDLIGYWKPRLHNPDNLQTVDPVFEYKENLRDYYRYLAWAEEHITVGDDY